MNLELTPEQLLLRDSVRRFLADGAPARRAPLAAGEPDQTADAGWRGLAGIGVTGVLVAEKQGGAGLTMTEAGIAAEELGRALAFGAWLPTAVAVPRALARTGAADRAEPLLAAIADGTVIATIGLRDAAAPRVAAFESQAGTVVTGKVSEVPGAAAASVLLVLAADGDGTGLFAVDIPSPGVTVTPLPAIDQSRRRFRVLLDGAPASRLGTATAEAIQAVVDDVLAVTAADALGAAQAALDLAVEYAKTRTQFGRPVGAFQAVQHLCADMHETVELARGGVMHALWAADAADAAERHLAAIRVKAFAGQLAAVGEAAIQVLGGIGYTWEHDAHRYLRRLLSWSAFLGSPDGYLREIGSGLAQGARTQRSTAARGH